MHRLVGCKLEHRCWRVQGGCQNKNLLGMWMTSCTGSACGGFWEIWKSRELRTRHRMKRVDFRDSQRPDEIAHYGRYTRWGADGKVIIERLCVSLPYVETFNSKVIKGFVPELSRYVFFVFWDSYVLCIYVMNILCTFPICMYGFVTHIYSSHVITFTFRPVPRGNVWTYLLPRYQLNSFSAVVLQWCLWC